MSGFSDGLKESNPNRNSIKAILMVLSIMNTLFQIKQLIMSTILIFFTKRKVESEVNDCNCWHVMTDSFITTICLPIYHIVYRVFGQNLKLTKVFQVFLSEICGSLKAKIIIDREDISNHDVIKENKIRQLIATPKEELLD